MLRFGTGFDIDEPKFFSEAHPVQSEAVDSPTSATTGPSMRSFSMSSDTMPNAAYMSEAQPHIQVGFCEGFFFFLSLSFSSPGV